MARFGETLKHAWNIFTNQDQARDKNSPWPIQPVRDQNYYGGSSGSRPDRTRLRIPNERSIISSIYTRLSIDVASVDMRHVRLDEQKRYVEDH